MSDTSLAAFTPWHSSEPIEQYDSLFPVLPHYVAHYTIGGGRVPKIGLPDKNALELERDFASVLIAHLAGISIPWAKKRYVDEMEECRWLGFTERIDRIFAAGNSSLEAYVRFGLNFKKRENSFEGLSMQFYYRSMAALEAAKRLSELGYLCEVAAILRMALEQFAFAGSLWGFSPSKKLRNLRAKQSINHLKCVVPASGRLYGLLSKYTHFEFEHHTHFFGVSSEKTFTIQWGSVLRAYATHLLFLTMVCIGRYTLALSRDQFGEIPASVSGLEAFIKAVDTYSEEVCKILKPDSVLANLDNLLMDLIKS